MPDVDKIIAFENGDMDWDDIREFFQDGIDRGWVWQLQGSYGRMARDLINGGECHAKEQS